VVAFSLRKGKVATLSPRAAPDLKNCTLVITTWLEANWVCPFLKAMFSFESFLIEMLAADQFASPARACASSAMNLVEGVMRKPWVPTEPLAVTSASVGCLDQANKIFQDKADRPQLTY